MIYLYLKLFLINFHSHGRLIISSFLLFNSNSSATLCIFSLSADDLVTSFKWIEQSNMLIVQKIVAISNHAAAENEFLYGSHCDILITRHRLAPKLNLNIDKDTEHGLFNDVYENHKPSKVQVNYFIYIS